MSGSSGYAPARGGFSAADGYNNECNGSTANCPPGMNLGSDFPFVCETCLGPNPYVRMIKMQFGSKECKISARPYQPFRWRAGPGGRHKETIVAYEVARQKNVCQACLVDMAYGLPVAVRDSLLGSAGADIAPDSRPNADYYWQEKNAEFTRAMSGGSAVNSQDGMNPSQQLLQLSRALNSRGGASGGTAFRNLPKMCSFWLKGVCNRGSRCPFRPCCGTFKFPELASQHPEECQALITQLTDQGSAEVGSLALSLAYHLRGFHVGFS
jgi:pre-mRNA-splicing factor RBM22/SLT11